MLYTFSALSAKNDSYKYLRQPVILLNKLQIQTEIYEFIYWCHIITAYIIYIFMGVRHLFLVLSSESFCCVYKPNLL